MIINLDGPGIFAQGVAQVAFPVSQIRAGHAPQNYRVRYVRKRQRVHDWHHRRYGPSASGLRKDGDGVRSRREVRNLTDAFIVHEEEQFVLDQRATQVAAELIQSQRYILRREVVQGIKRIVAKEFKHAAVEIVTPRLGDDVDDVTVRTAVLGRERARHDFEFLDAVDAGTVDARLLAAQLGAGRLRINSGRVRAIEQYVGAGKGSLISTQAGLPEAAAMSHRSTSNAPIPYVVP